MSGRAGTAAAPENPFPPDPILVETLDRLFGNTCTHEAVQAAEATGWAADIWDPFAETGAPWVGVPEEAAGAPVGTIADAAAVLRRCGYHAAPLPVAETGLLGGWLAGAAGLPLPEGPVTVVPGRPEDRLELRGDRLSGVAHNVAWAAAVLADPGARRRPGRVPSSPPPPPSGPAATWPASPGRSSSSTRSRSPAAARAARCERRGPAAAAARFARACLMTGALERVADLTVGYANERVQFGKPIATFQAVAQHLVRLASETHLAVMAFQVAVGRGAATGASRVPGLEVGCAKAVAGEAADVGTARAHQAHGAIGMTQEYAPAPADPAVVVVA